MQAVRPSLLALAALTFACHGDRPRPAPPTPSAAPTNAPSAHATNPIVDAAASPVPAVHHPGAFANLDPSDDLTVGPPDALADCDDQLTHAGVTFRAASLPVHTDPAGKLVCGAPQVVTYVRGPTGVVYEPAPLITCAMALALASYERILQEEAQRVFATSVTRVEQLGTYNCRGIVRFKGVISEHSYANAIDVAKFVLKSGKAVTVLGDFDMGDSPPAHPAGDFLRAISYRGQDEDVFSNVLTPFWDAAHKNHFHLDLARYRVNGVRPQR